MASKGNGVSFNIGDLVFAKLRGYTPWPARITHSPNAKKQYTVHFYGTGEIGYVKPENLWPYSQHRQKYATRKNMKRGAYSKAMIEIKCAYKQEPIPMPNVSSNNNHNQIDNENNNNNYDSDKEAAEKATKATIPKPSGRPEQNRENEVVLAYMPMAKVLGINVGYKKPKEFENAAAEQLWLGNARKAANLLKEKLLSGQVDARRLPAGQIIFDPSPRATGQQQEVGLMRELQDHEAKLYTERDFVEICAQIRDSLGTRQANVGRSLQLLNLFKKLELDKYMLLRNPECVETMQGLQRYIGNVKAWQLDPADEAEFSYFALSVRQMATTICAGFQKLFSFAEGADFFVEFSKEVATYKTHTDPINGDLRVLMNERSYRKLVRDKRGQRKH